MLFKKKTIVALILFALQFESTSAQLNKIQIDSLKRELSKAVEDTNKVNLLIQLGNNEGYYDAAKGFQYGRQASDLSRKLNFDIGSAKAAFLMSSYPMDQGNFELADSLLTTVENIKSFSEKQENQARLFNERGMMSFMRGNYYAAADFWSRATTLFDELKDTANFLVTYQNLIAVLAEVRNYNWAIQLSKKVLPIAISMKDTLSMGYCLQSLTTNLIYQGSLIEAEKYMNQLMPIAETTIDNNLSSDAFSTIGTYYYSKNDYGRALPYYLKAVEKSESLENQFQLANHTKSIGSTYLKLGNLPLAKKYLEESLRLANKYHNTRAIYDASLALSNYYEELGNHQRALSYLQQHLQLKDSILDADTRNYTSYLENQFESKKKENEILRLQKIEQQKNFELRQRNILFLVVVGLLVVLLIISVLIYKNQRNKQKIATQQQILQLEKIQILEKQHQVVSLQSMINGQETERTRIARDLHDGLGGIFSTVKMHYSTLQHDIPEMKTSPLYKRTFDLINNASDELRKVAHNMMPEVLMKLGLVEALKDFCNNINAGKSLRISLQVYGMDKRLDTSTEIMLYRIIQELLNNILKHAAATETIVQFNRDGNHLNLTIEDNGKGFDPIEVEEKQSMGMATVRSRVDYLNGKLTIDSRKDIGTTVLIDILLNEN